MKRDSVVDSLTLLGRRRNILQSLLCSLTTWFLLADAFEKSALYQRFPLRSRWELLIEKFNVRTSQRLRILPGGFVVRKNRSDLNVLISMPLEYSIIEQNFTGRLVNVLDVGANIGAFAIYLSSFLKVNRYLGLEPSPDSFVVLKKNLEVLGPFFIAEQCAASDVTKEWRFNSSGEPARIRQSRLGSEAVKAFKIDDIPFIAEYETLDLLKIDIEGDEVLALRGAERTLKKTKSIIIELHLDKIGADGLSEIMETLNTDFERITFHRSPDENQMNCLFWRRDASR